MRQRFSATRPSFSAERLSCFVVFGNSRRPRDCDFLVYRLSPYPVKVIDHLKECSAASVKLYIIRGRCHLWPLSHTIEARAILLFILSSDGQVRRNSPPRSTLGRSSRYKSSMRWRSKGGNCGSRPLNLRD